MPNGASPQPDEVYRPAGGGYRLSGGGLDSWGGSGVVGRLRSRVARGGWPSRS
jgi:hypothetical protein